MFLKNIRPMSWNPLGSVFREDIPQTRRLKKLLATLVSKYHFGSDTILLSWILKTYQINMDYISIALFAITSISFLLYNYNSNYNNTQI